MIEVQNKASKKHWNEVYSDVTPYKVSKSDPVCIWIQKFITRVNKGECIEIGCYPGRYLALFGEYGYTLSGIDFTEKLSSVPNWLQGQGYQTGKFWQEDFLKFTIPNTFDLVTSFGFIEHFTQWQEVLRKHLPLVKEGGVLIIETPNLRGIIPRILHTIFNPKTFKKHVISAMNTQKWEEILKANGFTIHYSGYFGGFHIWSEKEKRSILRKVALKFFLKIRPFVEKSIKYDNKIYSAYCGIIAQKKGG